MGKLVLLCVVGGTVLSVSSGAKAALTTRVSADAEALAAELIGTATGLDAGISTFTGGAHAAGFFAGGLASGLGIESGVLLTSGSVSEAGGPNSHDASSCAYGLPGDATLSALAGGEGTYDAAILEFDFTSVGGALLIRYVFASEEYNEFVYTGHDDIVGIFLDGEDIALVSGTSIPVSVDNVNGGGPGFGVNPSYPEFFHNNDLQNGGPFFDLAYDGFTDVFVAGVSALPPGSHHLKLAVADVGDPHGDSAIFIESFSFTPLPSDSVATAVPVPTPASLVMAVLGSILVQRGLRMG